MKDIPIIMSPAMVLATIREVDHPGEGKTETRRLAWREKVTPKNPTVVGSTTTRERIASPWQRVKPGDRLYVRENWKPHSIYAGWTPCDVPKNTNIFYRADDRYAPSNTPWVPSIHMPRWASRLTLVVTAVKIEKIQSITEASARAEGASSRPHCYGYCRQDPRWSMDWSHVGQPARGIFGEPGVGRQPLDEASIALGSARSAFGNFWAYLHGYESWDTNPEVVAVSFIPHLVNIDRMEKAEAAA